MMNTRWQRLVGSSRMRPSCQLFTKIQTVCENKITESLPEPLIAPGTWEKFLLRVSISKSLVFLLEKSRCKSTKPSGVHAKSASGSPVSHDAFRWGALLRSWVVPIPRWGAGWTAVLRAGALDQQKNMYDEWNLGDGEKRIEFVVFSVSISCPVWPEKRLDQSAPASHARLGQVLLPFASVQLTVHAWGTFYWRHRGRMQRHFLGGTMSLLRLPTRRSAKAQRWRLVLIMIIQCILGLFNMITLLQRCYIKTMKCWKTTQMWIYLSHHCSWAD